MKPRLDPRLQAKKMTNAVYQPMGKLMCHVSSDEMWNWAKERVAEQLELIISEIPTDQENINPNWKYWDDVRKQLKDLP
jgi:hypothetical protein